MDTILLNHDLAAGTLIDGKGLTIVAGFMNITAVDARVEVKDVIALKEAGFDAAEIIDMFGSGVV